MKNESYLKYLLADNFSLEKYYKEQKKVTLEDVKRSVLLKVRERQYCVPDHYYRLGTEFSFLGVDCLSKLFTVGLRKLADEYLEMHEGIVFVKGEKMNDWQLLLTQIPPLLLVIIKIWEKYGQNTDSILDFSNKHLLEPLRYTALPPAYIPEMKTLRKDISGFYDLHIHLNGALETDLVWQDFLRCPDRAYFEITEALKNDKVREQFGQLTTMFDSIDFLNLFTIAGKIRDWLCSRVVYNLKKEENLEEFLCKQMYSYEYDKEHPLRAILGENALPLVMEGTFYIKMLDYLSINPHDYTVAGAFHYYLLILGLCNRLLVQQTDAFGFEQFQKYTSNNLREFSEKTYEQRFFQLAGNDLKNFIHIEGRFSPKENIDKNIELVKKIKQGFDLFKEGQKRFNITPSTLSLVAHFIKKPNKKIQDIRFKSLREDLNRRTEALIALINTKGTLGQMIVGADAAASEFDTPPEVFATSFHRLRENGLKHFTYHAGEDFFHILSGLRAIYEAIIFLGLQAGDRIGHATASGVDVCLWKKNIGNKLWMRMEDYMDDLVFSYYLITIFKEKKLEHLLPLIALRVEEYASKIYSEKISIYELIEAWKMRKEDALILGESCIDESRIMNIFRKYHTVEIQERGRNIISIDAYDIFGEEDLVCMQHLLLRIMHQKQIVIETLPTSNVIIGQHHDFTTYHLFNWYSWSKSGLEIPPIVVGTDDTGIFATNIYNEYCHIYCCLVFEHHVSSYEAIDYIERLHHNARVYVF